MHIEHWSKTRAVVWQAPLKNTAVCALISTTVPLVRAYTRGRSPLQGRLEIVAPLILSASLLCCALNAGRSVPQQAYTAHMHVCVSVCNVLNMREQFENWISFERRQSTTVLIFEPRRTCETAELFCMFLFCRRSSKYVNWSETINLCGKHRGCNRRLEYILPGVCNTYQLP